MYGISVTWLDTDVCGFNSLQFVSSFEPLLFRSYPLNAARLISLCPQHGSLSRTTPHLYPLSIKESRSADLLHLTGLAYSESIPRHTEKLLF